MKDVDQSELKRRLDSLAPFFLDLGEQTLETYSRAGILDVIADGSLPVSDALFTVREGRYAYHPHGPVYLYLTRAGKLQLGGQQVDVPLARAILTYAHLARPGQLEDVTVIEGATEWFPPPRFLLDAETSRLYIASVSAKRPELPGPGFVPFEEYVHERAQLFVQAFQNAGNSA